MKHMLNFDKRAESVVIELVQTLTADPPHAASMDAIKIAKHKERRMAVAIGFILVHLQAGEVPTTKAVLDYINETGG